MCGTSHLEIERALGIFFKQKLGLSYAVCVVALEKVFHRSSNSWRKWLIFFTIMLQKLSFYCFVFLKPFCHNKCNKVFLLLYIYWLNYCMQH